MRADQGRRTERLVLGTVIMPLWPKTGWCKRGALARAFSVVNIHGLARHCVVAPRPHLGQDALCPLDPPIQELAAQHANLDLGHAQPVGMLGDVVELEPAQAAARPGRKEGLVKRADGVGGHIIQQGSDALCQVTVGDGRACRWRSRPRRGCR